MCNTIKSRKAGSIQGGGGQMEQVESDRIQCGNKLTTKHKEIMI